MHPKFNSFEEIREWYKNPSNGGFDIPELEYYPSFHKVAVWRTPVDQKTEGGLWKPEVATDYDPKIRGILLAGGLIALDRMRDHGIGLGDKILWSLSAGTNHQAKRDAGSSGQDGYITYILVDEIIGSKDLFERIKSHELSPKNVLAQDASCYLHVFAESVPLPTNGDITQPLRIAKIIRSDPPKMPMDALTQDGE